jgi:hypothetical protein
LLGITAPAEAAVVFRLHVAGEYGVPDVGGAAGIFKRLAADAASGEDEAEAGVSIQMLDGANESGGVVCESQVARIE